jgi:hypothetical protein
MNKETMGILGNRSADASKKDGQKRQRSYIAQGTSPIQLEGSTQRREKRQIVALFSAADSLLFMHFYEHIVPAYGSAHEPDAGIKRNRVESQMSYRELFVSLLGTWCLMMVSCGTG